MSAAMGTSAAPMLRRLPFSVSFLPSSLERISSAASPNVDFAIHGILFGTSDGAAVAVRLAQPFPTVAITGSGVIAEDEDAALEAFLALARSDAGKTGLQPVGWYAVRTSGGLLARDLAIHLRHFTQTGNLALVIVPEHDSKRLEIYCRSTDGDFSAQSHRWGVLRLKPGQTFDSPLDAVMRPQVRDDLYLQTYGASLTRSPMRRFGGRALRWLWVGFIFLLALAVTYLVASRFNRIDRGSSKSVAPGGGNAASIDRSEGPGPLQLQVTRDGKQVAVRWNSANAAIRKAHEGTLEIHDGSSDHQVHLDGAQLATGSMLYTPSANRLVFRLSVPTQDGSALAEVVPYSVREAKPAQLQPVAQSSSPRPPVKASSDSDDQPLHVESPIQPSHGSAAEAPVMRPRPTPRISRSPKVAVQPPQPLHEVTPNVSGVAAGVLSSSKQVTVTVWIDTSGHVYRAAASNVNVGNAALVPASVAAARQWVFAPASVGGRLVPGQHTIIFHFQAHN